MADAIAYENGITTMPSWVPDSVAEQPRGYAYEHDGRYIHMFGRAGQLWTISSGLTFFPAVGRNARRLNGEAHGACLASG